MGRQRVAQNSMNVGELSKKMEGRADIDKHANGLRTLENCFIDPRGGVVSRPGTKHVKEEMDSSVKGRLIPFRFSNTQAYVIELGNLKARFFRNNAQIEADDVVTIAAAVDATADTIEARDADATGTAVSHSLAHNQGPLRLTTTDTLPAGTDGTTDYYVKLPQEHTFVNTDITVGTDEIAIAAHLIEDGEGPYMLRTTGELPAELDTNDEYFIKTSTSGANAIELELSVGGGVVDIVTVGAAGGTHTLYPTDAYKRQKFQLAAAADGAAVNITDQGVGTHTLGAALGITPAAELDTPYLTADLYDIQFKQLNDVVYIVGDGYPVGKISRTGHAKWQYDEVTLLDGPYFLESEGELTEGTTITPSAASGNDDAAARITLTASSALFSASDIGRLVRLEDDADGDAATEAWGYCVIREFVSTTVVRVNILQAFVGTSAANKWRMGVFGSATATGYPKVIGMTGDRVYYAGASGSPDSFYGTRVGLYEDMTPTDIGVDGNGNVFDDHAVSFTLQKGQADAINWIETVQSMVVGTSDGIWDVKASIFRDPITPSSIQANASLEDSASTVQPVVSGSEVVYTSADKREVLAIAYANETEVYQNKELTINADHITYSGVQQLAKQRYPWRAIHARLDDGTVAVLCYVNEQGIQGWGRFIYGADDTSAAVVESLAVIPNATDTGDELWLSVKRTFEGSTYRSIEYMAAPWDGENDNIEDAYFLDCGVTVDNGANSRTMVPITNEIDFLAGDTAHVVADGIYRGTITVSASLDFVAGDVSTVNNELTLDHSSGATRENPEDVYPVSFSNSNGALPAGLTAGIPYKLIENTPDDFEVHTYWQEFSDGHVDTGAETITLTAHGMAGDGVDSPIYFVLTAGSVPGYTDPSGTHTFSLGVKYWANIQDANTIKISLTQGGSTLNLTTAGSGTWHIITPNLARVTVSDTGSGTHHLNYGAYLDRITDTVHVGLYANRNLEPFQPSPPDRAGSTEGALIKQAHSYLRVLNTSSFKIGPDSDSLSPVEFEENTFDTQEPPESGIKDVQVETGWSRRPSIYIQQDEPLPFFILGLIADIRNSDK